MSRRVLAFAVLLGVPAFASAQVGGGTPRPPTFVPISPFMPGISPAMPPLNPGGTAMRPNFPFPPIWGGGFFPYYGYGYNYGGQPAVVQVVGPVGLGGGSPAPASERVVAISNEFPAVLVLEFPSAAEVWVNGKKAEGEATNEWTLTSAVLPAGGEYKFEVKARWKAGGKTYEAERSVVVAGGKRSRAIVVAGTEVRE
jgi:uncharacterized protein (TIGR03000 family)